MKNRQELIFVIGADGSGKDKLSEMLAKETGGRIVKLNNYEGSRPFKLPGKMANWFVKKGEQKRSKKLVVIGYGLNAALFGPYSYVMRHKAAKEGKPIIFNRYIPYDVEAMAGAYGKGRADNLLKASVKLLSAYKRPRKGDTLYYLEVDPKAAMERVNARKGLKQMHENERDIGKMNLILKKESDRAERKGLRVIRKRF